MKNKKNGFTLIELLAVIAILAIIVIVATMQVNKTVKSQRTKSYVTSVTNIQKTAKLACSDDNLVNIKDYLSKTDDIDIIIAGNDIEITPKSTGKFTNLDLNQLQSDLKSLKDSGKITISDAKITINNPCNSSLLPGEVETSPAPDATEPSLPETETCSTATTSFAKDCWSTIIENVKNGNTSAYNVGDEKMVDMGTLGKHILRVANKSTPTECNKEEFSQSACGFVIEFADLITTHVMNPAGKYNGEQYNNGWNRDGYPKSSLKKYLEDTIYEALPEDVKKGIITTSVVSGHGYTDKNNFTSKEKLFLLDSKEVFGDSNKIEYNTALRFERQLDYYKEKEFSGKVYYDDSGRYKDIPLRWYIPWWLRSADSSYDGAFHVVETSHVTSKETSKETIPRRVAASSDYGVSPAFRIGK